MDIVTASFPFTHVLRCSYQEVFNFQSSQMRFQCRNQGLKGKEKTLGGKCLLNFSSHRREAPVICKTNAKLRSIELNLETITKYRFPRKKKPLMLTWKVQDPSSTTQGLGPLGGWGEVRRGNRTINHTISLGGYV